MLEMLQDRRVGFIGTFQLMRPEDSPVRAKQYM
jgi:hypothetical protein